MSDAIQEPGPSGTQFTVGGAADRGLRPTPDVRTGRRRVVTGWLSLGAIQDRAVDFIQLPGNGIPRISLTHELGEPRVRPLLVCPRDHRTDRGLRRGCE